LAPVGPLIEKSLAELRQAVQAAGTGPEDVLRVTCFLNSLENLEAMRTRVAADYSRATLDFVQTQREPIRAVAGCEAVAAAREGTGSRLEMVNSAGGESHIAIVRSAHVLFTSSQASFGFDESDARLAFERLKKVLEQNGVPAPDVAMVRFYPLSQKIADQIGHVRTSFFDAAHPPAASLLLFEGLSSQDAGFAVDVVAAKD